MPKRFLLVYCCSKTHITKLFRIFSLYYPKLALNNILAFSIHGIVKVNLNLEGEDLKHKFNMQLHWPGGRNNVGTIEASKLKTKVSIPKEMDGPDVGTNPDEMLLGAAATCYIISLGAMLERAEIEATLEMESVGIVDVTNGVFTYEEIQHRAIIQLQHNTEENRRIATRLSHKAEGTCMISKALKGNVNIIVFIDFI